MKFLLTGLVIGLLGLTLNNIVKQSKINKQVIQLSQSQSNLIFKMDSNTTNILIQFQQQYIGLDNHKQHIKVLWTNAFPIMNPLTNNTIGGKPVTETYFKQ